MEIKGIQFSGLMPALEALHLPFGKPCKSTKDSINFEDLGLLKKLIKAGDEHAKVMRGVIIWLDIKAPIYWWREMETYRIGRERLSCESTMHIQCKGLTGESLQKVKAQMPMGKEQRAIDMYSYQALRHIYKQRKNHRLPEWKAFCKFVEALPYSELIVL